MKMPVFSSIAIMLSFAILACGLSPSAPQGNAATSNGSLATLVSQQLTEAVKIPTATAAARAPSSASPRPGLPPSLRIVYSRSGNLWLQEGNTQKQLTGTGQDSEPKFSSDGLLIAFRRGVGLWVLNSDGSQERPLAAAADLAGLPHTGSGQVQPRRFEFAPGSHAVYFNTSVAGDPFALPQDDLIRTNADQPSLQALLNADQGGDQFRFSPDGSKLALTRPDRINILSLGPNTLKTVFSFPLVMMYSEQSYIPEIVWMPDGSGLKTVIPPPDALGDPGALSRFMFIPADGSQAAQLAEFNAVPAFKDRAYLSPDGAQVLYAKPHGNSLELHVIDASTADKAYSQHPADQFGLLGWAPDSLHFLYWVGSSGHARLGPPDLPGVTLTDAASASSLAWIDANRFLIISDHKLILGGVGQPGQTLADGVDGGFDFSIGH